MKHSRNEIPTIDVNLVTIKTKSGKEFGFDTSNQVEVEIQTEESDAVKLVVKGILRAQKPKQSTITGHKITLHDNVFNPELVKVLQGGKLLYFNGTAKTSTSETPSPYGFASYEPPVAGSAEKGEVFELNAYSAIYNAAGLITGYEKTTYPNCKGEPVAFASQDGTFRAPSYTINSAPDTGEAPYTIAWVADLPTLDDANLKDVKITAVDAVITLTGANATKAVSDLFTVDPAAALTGNTPKLTVIGGPVGATVNSTTFTAMAKGTYKVKFELPAKGEYASAEAIAEVVVK